MYYVIGNLHHDNKPYRKGDTVELSDAAAAPLLRRGIIQSDKPTDEAPTVAKGAQPETPVKSPKAKRTVVGGEPLETGEPSIDGPAADQKSEATDVTPPTDSSDPSADL